jgi:hypothetical protein
MRQDQRALGHLAAVHGPADANYNFGQLLVQRGRPADATPYFEAAVAQNPHMQPAHVALAKLRGETVTETPPTTATPAGAPQPAPTTGPQFGYPATARSPEIGASSYIPPTYHAPSAPFPATSYPTTAGAPARYLPPVAIQPGAVPVQR